MRQRVDCPIHVPDLLNVYTDLVRHSLFDQLDTLLGTRKVVNAVDKIPSKDGVVFV
jgi:hypothetical protein